MITVNDKKLCENCFMETDQEQCPYCGYRKINRRDNTVLEMGSVLDSRYMIGGVIGKGGFGITYLAYDVKLEKRIAVKEYYPRGIASRAEDRATVSATDEKDEKKFQDGAEKFYKEAELVSQFNGNPNIVNVYDFFRENDTVYFTMGYLNGESLKTYINKKGRITEGQAMTVYKCMTNALLITHSMNILHRDISPDNIMLCNDGTIKLIDFGAARQVIAEESNSLSVILKQGYAPLEQYQKKGKQGPWTDIYALGATVYTCLTGKFLDDPMSRMEDDSEFSENRYGLSEGMWNIIRKSTMLKIEERYQSIIDLKKDLTALKIKEEPFTDLGSPMKIEYVIHQEVTGGDAAVRDGSSPYGEAREQDPNATVLLASDKIPTVQPTPAEQVSNGGYTGQPAPVEQYGNDAYSGQAGYFQDVSSAQYGNGYNPVPPDNAGMGSGAGAQPNYYAIPDPAGSTGKKGSIPKILFAIPVLVIVVVVVIVLQFSKIVKSGDSGAPSAPNERTMMGDASTVLKGDGVDGSVVDLTVISEDYNEKYGVYTVECDVTVHFSGEGSGEDKDYSLTLIYDNEDDAWVLSELSHQ
ncbi:MAG: serine/threonine protein kinase [Lachnospiraceae bacterium]|nr:serine/threonine protein kinase [Lachnospiraceae bacterium]